MERKPNSLLLLVSAIVIGRAAWAAVVKGPYLQDARQERITIAAETDTAARCLVEWGRGFLQSTNLTASGLHHEGVIGGLSPSTCYPYRLVCDGQAGADSYFCTAPRANEPFSFAAIGDTRSNHAVHQQMLDLVARETVDFYINSGDLVSSGGSDADWTAFFQIEGELMKRLPFYPAVGNHDDDLGSLANYERLFALPRESSGKESYYSFVYGNTLFAVVDNQASLTWSLGLDTTQKNWLLGTLKAAPPEIRHKIILVHECLYSSKSGRSGDWVLRWLKDDLKAAGAELFICGHDHYYERGLCDNGLPYITSGGGGAPLYDTDNPTEGRPVNISFPAHTVYYSKSLHHYLRADVAGDWLRICAKDSAAVAFDCLEIGEPPRPDGGEDADGGEDGGQDGDEDGGAQEDGQDLAPVDAGCDCSSEPDAPVCGEDGRTYRNLCELDCARVGKAHDGPCAIDPCSGCPEIEAKVCGTDGVTYQNACFLECRGAELDHPGPCGQPNCQNCPTEIAEVCGKDGRTYRNHCVLECMQVEKAYDGPCRPPSKGCGCSGAGRRKLGLLPCLAMFLLFVRRRRPYLLSAVALAAIVAAGCGYSKAVREKLCGKMR